MLVVVVVRTLKLTDLLSPHEVTIGAECGWVGNSVVICALAYIIAVCFLTLFIGPLSVSVGKGKQILSEYTEDLGPFLAPCCQCVCSYMCVRVFGIGFG